MFAYRHDILKALIADGVKLVVLGRKERIADLPEYAHAEDRIQASMPWRARWITRRRPNCWSSARRTCWPIPKRPNVGRQPGDSRVRQGALPRDRHAPGRSQLGHAAAVRSSNTSCASSGWTCGSTSGSRRLYEKAMQRRQMAGHRRRPRPRRLLDRRRAGLLRRLPARMRRRPTPSTRSAPARRSRPTIQTSSPWSTKRWPMAGRWTGAISRHLAETSHDRSP